MKPIDRHGGRLTVDLDAIAANYRLLAGLSAPAGCAAAVKANAYGLGVARVAPALWAAGCRDFFVATADEGVELRGVLPEARISILNGPPPGDEALLAEYGLSPVLNSLADVERWAAFAARERRLAVPPAALHLDTGMNRLGLPGDEMEALAERPEILSACALDLVMSHLACADQPGHPMNEAQRLAFEACRRRFPGVPASLANSSGVFLGAAYRLDLVRPGVALYGGNPTPDKPNPMAEAVHLQGKIVQIHSVGDRATVGYGATHSFAKPARIATVAVGYADGYLRSAGNRAFGCVGGVRVPVVGRVSMDLTAFDITAADPERTRPGDSISLIGGGADLDEVAAAAGTISYELLTRLGGRLERVYVEGAPA